MYFFHSFSSFSITKYIKGMKIGVQGWNSLLILNFLSDLNFEKVLESCIEFLDSKWKLNSNGKISQQWQVIVAPLVRRSNIQLTHKLLSVAWPKTNAQCKDVYFFIFQTRVSFPKIQFLESKKSTKYCFDRKFESYTQKYPRQ